MLNHSRHPKPPNHSTFQDSDQELKKLVQASPFNLIDMHPVCMFNTQIKDFCNLYRLAICFTFP